MTRFSKLTFFLVLISLTSGQLINLGGVAGATRPVRFGVIGDTGSGDEGQMEVARQLTAHHKKQAYDFILMLGDNIYDTGKAKYIVPRFEEPYKDLLDDGMKFYAILGNHDIIDGLEFQINYPKFNMGGHRYYNFVKGDGMVEFFGLDTNDMTDEQLAWLEEALSNSTARWKVAYSHHPIYSSARMHSAYTKLRKQLEPLYVKYGVVAAFSGHSHCYERLKPQKGVHYFIQGSSGKIKRKTIDRKNPILEVGNDEINSFMIVEVNEDEFKIEARGSDDSLIDSHVIKYSEMTMNRN